MPISSKICFILGSDSTNFFLRVCRIFFLVCKVILHYALDILGVNFWTFWVWRMSSQEHCFLATSGDCLGEACAAASLSIQLFYLELRAAVILFEVHRSAYCTFIFNFVNFSVLPYYPLFLTFKFHSLFFSAFLLV